MSPNEIPVMLMMLGLATQRKPEDNLNAVLVQKKRGAVLPVMAHSSRNQWPILMRRLFTRSEGQYWYALVVMLGPGLLCPETKYQ